MNYEQKLRDRLAELKPAREQAMITFVQLDAAVGELEVLLGIREPAQQPPDDPPKQSP